MSLRRVGLSNSLSSQAKITSKRLTLSRVSLRRFPFPTAAAAAAVIPYIEDVFSNYLYTGTSAAQTINNGIDLAGKGGLVWIKQRTSNAVTASHQLTDTVRGVRATIFSNLTIAQDTNATYRLTAFNSNGFSVDDNGAFGTNVSGETYASWTFRRQAKFFDVVTYTGNGSNGRVISHLLGSAPGCIIIKRTDSTGNWVTWHRALPDPVDGVLYLNSTNAQMLQGWFSSIGSTSFTISSDPNINASDGTYVAYLFAHNAGGFGLTGTDNVISCGSYTGNGLTAGPTVTLGYEPQWLMIKRSSSGAEDWMLLDVSRGMSTTSALYLRANLSAAEASAGQSLVTPTATGFQITADSSWPQVNTNGVTYIYMAIRRGPMKIPTSGTSVFKPVRRTGNGSTTIISAGFPIDASFTDTGSGTYLLLDRLRGGNYYFRTISTNAEAPGGAAYDTQDGYRVGTGGTFSFNTNDTSYSDHLFRRAPGFFDVVCWTGTGTTRNISHNLGVKAELVIRKVRNGTADGASDWVVGFNFAPDGSSSGNIYLQSNGGAQNPSGSVFFSPMTSTTFGTDSSFNNQSGKEYVAYLFATCPGVSKVGSYTGNGSSQTIDCGFSAGARYVLIKRTDSTGDWTIFDSALGIVGDNEVFGRFNSPGGVDSSAVADHIDPTSVGFIVNQVASSNINVNNATYLFLAIA